MNCKKCNRDIPDDARLCPYCGTPVVIQDRNFSKMKCKKCKKLVPDNINLCPYCGTPITMEEKVTQKVYKDMLTNLQEFILKKPMDLNKAKIVDWSVNTIEQETKRPKSFYIILALMFATGIILTLILLSEGFK